MLQKISSPTSPDSNSSKLSYVSGYAPTRFGWGKLAELLMGSPKAPNIDKVRPIFKHSTILCCWAEQPLPPLSLCSKDRNSTIFMQHENYK
jgi:hypothetical protein